MNFFECCHKCKPPKRYPGCSAKCPEYKKDREKYDECVKRDKLRRDLNQYNKTYPND